MQGEALVKQIAEDGVNHVPGALFVARHARLGCSSKELPVSPLNRLDILRCLQCLHFKCASVQAAVGCGLYSAQGEKVMSLRFRDCLQRAVHAR